MSNAFLADFYVEHVDRMMLGIEPVDALRAGRVAPAIDIVLDGLPTVSSASWRPDSAAARWGRSLGFPDAIGSLRRIARHDSCRYALLFKPGMTPPVTLRIFDGLRRFAPRRIRYPAPADILTSSPRIRRPALFPGAAYAVSEAVTGLRGRVTWNESTTNEVPARWVRVEAQINGQVVGRAHGDDRGEFLLLLDNLAGGLGELPVPLVAQVTVFGPAGPQPLPVDDPLGDLPLEVVADPDLVSAGTQAPPGYAATASSSRAVEFDLGRLLTAQPKFFFFL
jgi:hypothetical protein